MANDNFPRANYGPAELPRRCQCGCASTRVLRTTVDGNTKYRDRLCNSCAEIYTSVEHRAPQ